MKLLRGLINITLPIFLIMIFASLLTTKPYLMLSEGLYESHDDITYDYEYAAERIMGYLNYRYDDLFFGEDESVPDTDYILTLDEISHMEDVKTLYTSLRLVAVGSLLIAISSLIIIYKKDKKELYKTFKTLHYAPILFIMVVGGYILIDFNKAFTIFHEIFFTQGNWQFHWDDVLILLLPENFWMVSGLLILIFFSATLGLIYFLNEKYLKNA